MSEEASVSRRHFLTVATSVTGVVGLALTAAPFIASFKPSTRAQALGAPVTVDISKLEEGAMVRVVWRGQPVWVLHRSKTMLDALLDSTIGLKDPDSNESIQPTTALLPLKLRRILALTAISGRDRRTTCLRGEWSMRSRCALTCQSDRLTRRANEAQ